MHHAETWFLAQERVQRYRADAELDRDLRTVVRHRRPRRWRRR
jgi:hypothetical protein